MKTALAYVIRIVGLAILVLFWSVVLTLCGLCAYAVYTETGSFPALLGYIALGIGLFIVLVCVINGLVGLWYWATDHLDSR